MTRVECERGHLVQVPILAMEMDGGGSLWVVRIAVKNGAESRLSR